MHMNNNIHIAVVTANSEVIVPLHQLQQQLRECRLNRKEVLAIKKSTAPAVEVGGGC